jgi:GTP-binding protein HflX
VADASEPEGRRAARARAVAEVLEEIGAGDVPRLLVLNKIDLVAGEEREALGYRNPDAVQVSAVTGEGLDVLAERLAGSARSRLTAITVTIPYADSGLLAGIYAGGSEVTQEPTDEGILVRALMPAAAAARLRASLNGTAG